MPVALVWFRRDLRIHDNAALTEAVRTADAVVPVFVIPDAASVPHSPGPASRAWMSASLASLDETLRKLGSRLVVRARPAGPALAALAAECGATRVHCQRDWTPAGLAEEDAARHELASVGVALEVTEGQLLVAPDALATGAGGPYRVFTPYWRAWERAWDHRAPLPPPGRVPAPASMPASVGVPAQPVGAPEVERWWTPGEPAALQRLAEFASGPLADYAIDRDRPDLRGSSELSPRLAWGELSPAQIAAQALSVGGESAAPFLRQLAWRDFAHHVLYHHPHTLDEPLREEFSAFAWCDDAGALEAWRMGRTGYPLVDAGMRQLLATGWMHNRVRLVVGSFFTKDLLQRWQDGAQWFEDTLVDYDPALNAFNWQWVSGSGADASPFFRIFNPTLQGAKFDPDGAYVRAWLPELAQLNARWMHRPWDAPENELARADVVLGQTYPHRIIDHAEARVRALAAYSALKNAAPR